MKNSLKFAALIRVSTEPQERQGTSLISQRKQAIATVKMMGGTIVGFYGGQEHATPGWEHKEVDRLVADAKLGKFEALIVDLPDRWSRDNRKSKEYLNVFIEKDIRFFVGSSEVDLFNRQAYGNLSMGVEMGEYQALIYRYEMLRGKIEKTKMGIPPVTKLPYGRLFDRKSKTWSIDAEKKRQVEKMAKEYLKGCAFMKMGPKYGMSQGSVRNVLLQAGEDFITHFRVPRFKINEKITIKMPRLLPESTIEKIRAKAESRKKWDRGTCRPEKYRPSGFLFDGKTGLSLCGSESKGLPYYKLHHPSVHGYSFRCWRIEEEVREHFHEIITDPEKLYQAVFGDRKKAPNEDLQKEREDLEANLKRNEKKIQSLIQTIEDAEDLKSVRASIKGRMTELENNAKEIQVKIQAVKLELNESLKLKVEDQMSKDLRKAMEQSYMSARFYVDREFLTLIFSGRDATGRKCGVYVWPEEGRKWHRGFRLEIVGQLPKNEKESQHKADKDPLYYGH